MVDDFDPPGARQAVCHTAVRVLDKQSGSFVLVDDIITITPSVLTNINSFAYAIELAAIDTILTKLNYTVLVDATSGEITITLPPLATSYNASTGIGLIFNISKTDLSTNKVIIDGDGAETINGDLTEEIIFQDSNVQLQAGPNEYRKL